MKEKLKHYAKEIVTFFVVMAILMNVVSIYKSQDLNKDSLHESGITLMDDVNFTFKKDKPILIHFWATWCKVCKLEVQNIQSISKDFEVVTIAVNSGSNDEIKLFMSEHNLNYKVVNDRDGYYAQKFKIAVYPTSFIYDKNKELVFSEVGFTSTLGLWLRMWWSSL